MEGFFYTRYWVFTDLNHDVFLSRFFIGYWILKLGWMSILAHFHFQDVWHCIRSLLLKFQ